jgi:hypothetical protein
MAVGDTLLLFSPLGNEPTSTLYATIDTRNQHPVLDFDAATAEAAVWTGIIPNNYGGNSITVYASWAASSATSGKVVWRTSFERIGNGSQDIDSDGFATAVTWTAATAPATSGNVLISSATHTSAQIDSVAVGESFRLKLERVGGDASDDMTGDAELVMLELRET